MFGSLRVRNYRLFTIGYLFKTLGIWMQFTAQDWLVLELSNDSASALGLVTGLQFIPVLLLSLYGGQLADRYDRRSLLVAVNAAFLLLGLAVGLLVSLHLMTLPLVFVFALLMGVVNAVEAPVRQAFISELVEPPLLPNALGLAAGTFNTARVAGPAVAGVGIWLLGLGPVFLVLAASYLVPPLLLLRMDTSRLLPSGRADGKPRIRDGLAYVWRHDELSLPMTLLFVVGLVGLNFQVTLPLLAKTVFGTGPQQFGLLTAALSAGSLVGALVSGGRRRRPSIHTVLYSGIAFGLLEAAAGLGPTFWITVALMVPTGFFSILYVQATNQRIQLTVDPVFRGRVMALFVLVLLGTTPIGGPIVGLVSEHLGPRVAVSGAGLISAAASAVALARHLHRSGARLRFTLRPRCSTPHRMQDPTAALVVGQIGTKRPIRCTFPIRFPPTTETLHKGHIDEP